VFCTKCGTDLPNDSRFCRSCGQTLSVVSTGGGGAAAAVGPARILETKPKRSLTIWTVVGLALLGVLGTVLYIQNVTSNPLPQVRAAQTPQAPPPQLHTVTTGDKAFTLSVGAATYFKFPVTAGAYDASLKGHFSATGGVGNDIEVFVMTEDDYVNWQNGHKVNTLYNSGTVTQDTLNVTLPTDAATYCLVFSNKSSWLTPRAVQANVNLTYYTRPVAVQR
jgi:hypothetical protein